MEAQRDTPVIHRPAGLVREQPRELRRMDIGLVIYDAGLVGTMLMLGVAYVASIFGLRTFDIAAIVASVMEGRAVAAGESSWWVSLLVLFLIGTYALPTLYALTFYQLKPVFTWKLGALFGFLLWAVTAAVLLAYVSLGVIFTALLSFLAYGIAFGVVTSPHGDRTRDFNEHYTRPAKTHA